VFQPTTKVDEANLVGFLTPKPIFGS
jgi:hypothetical protein